MTKRDETSVIMSIEGGLGNQLFQINAARILFKEEALTFIKFYQQDRKANHGHEDISVITDCEIDVQKVRHIQRKLLNLCLRMSTWNQSRARRSVVSLLRRFLSAFYSLFAFKKTNLVIANGVGYSKPSIKRNTRNIVIGYFQSYEFAAGFSLGNVFDDSDNNKYNTLRKQIEESKPIIVHVRLGDYTLDENIGVLTAEYFKNALAKFDITNKAIWVFSNDLELAQSFFFEGDYFELRCVDDTGLSAIELLELMTRGSGYVLSNSTFGWWAAFLRQNRTANVIVPLPWFANRQDPFLLIPDQWLQEIR
jgi:hypothetical protein